MKCTKRKLGSNNWTVKVLFFRQWSLSYLWLDYQLFCIVLICFVCLSLSCVLYAQCCLFLWIVHTWLFLRFSLMFIYFVLCLVCPMLPVSLDCPYLIVPSVFSNVYLLRPVSCMPNVACFSGLSILDCSFGFLYW
jgi:hypothetical protein